MNDPNNPFDESLPEDDTISRSARLAGMQQQLKQFRPRQPRLDFAEIESIASGIEKTQTDASTIIPIAGQVGLSMRRTRYPSSQIAGTIAASWICGVAVGAACVFLLMSNQKPFSHDIDRSASSDLNRETDRRIAETPSPIQSGVDKDSVESQKSTEAGQMDLSSGAHEVSSMMRWRGRYVKTSELLSQFGSLREFGSIVAVPTDSSTDSDSHSDSLISQFSPPQPMTQAELLRELLQPSKNTVH